MARISSQDKLQNFRFHVRLVDGQPYEESLTQVGAVEAGFKSVTLPQITTETTNYREGISTYAQKFGGPPTVETVSLMRGTAIGDTTFIDWIFAKIEGREYRADMVIYHMPITALRRNSSGAGRINTAGALPDGWASRSLQYYCYDCQPTRVKIGSDLDADSGDVSVTELEVDLEKFEVIQPDAVAEE